MKNKIYVAGIGPGGREHITEAVWKILREADCIIGYSTYTDLVKPFVHPEKIITSPMKREVERCTEALKLAEAGKRVALISSGDAGIYGMAGIMLEVIFQHGSDISVEVLPGVTSASAAAALLGAPIMHDYATISLSDLLTDWEIIQKRLHLAAQGDFVICLYNPKSKKRVSQIEEARSIMLQYKHEDTPVGIVKNAAREGEQVNITTLKNMLDVHIDMTTVIIVGNSQTFVREDTMITPRGYAL